jgi:hypothetical protein
MSPQPITAASVAVAVVAACREVGVDPTGVFEPHGAGCGRARILAAAGCVARLGWRPKDAARVFRITATNLAPSALIARKVTAEMVAAVCEALLPGGDASPARFRPDPDPDPSARAIGSARRVSSPAPDPAPATPIDVTISPAVLGWARRMRGPGVDGRPAWTFGEIARMFDLDPADLREALA